MVKVHKERAPVPADVLLEFEKLGVTGLSEMADSAQDICLRLTRKHIEKGVAGDYGHCAVANACRAAGLTAIIGKGTYLSYLVEHERVRPLVIRCGTGAAVREAVFQQDGRGRIGDALVPQDLYLTAINPSHRLGARAKKPRGPHTTPRTTRRFSGYRSVRAAV